MSCYSIEDAIAFLHKQAKDLEVTRISLKRTEEVATDLADAVWHLLTDLGKSSSTLHSKVQMASIMAARELSAARSLNLYPTDTDACHPRWKERLRERLEDA